MGTVSISDKNGDKNNSDLIPKVLFRETCTNIFSLSVSRLYECELKVEENILVI